MKHLLCAVLLFGVLVSFASATAQSTQGAAATAQTGMPGWPVPARPIPHHEPGQPARLGQVTAYQVSRLNAEGQPETVELTGLDALLASGTIADPLQGNYRLVDLSKVMFGNYSYDPDPDSLSVSTYAGTSLNPVPGSGLQVGDRRFNAIAAGDLNGDLIDEQLVAWVDSATSHINLQVRELPGALGPSTAAPAVIAHPNGEVDVLVRGYDDALWRLHSNGTNQATWDTAGGLLLSGPAAVSRAAGEVDLFALGLDNQVYHTRWISPTWSAWTLVDCGDGFSAGTPSFPLAAIPAPAAVNRAGSQLDLFRRGPDHTLRWCHSGDGLTWDTWQNLGGMLASEPSAVALGDGRMQVIARGADGFLWYRTFDGDWGNWQRLQTPEPVADDARPVLTSPAAGQVAISLAGAAEEIWSIHNDGSGWGTWSSIPVVYAGKSVRGKQSGAVTMDGIDDRIAAVVDVSESTYAVSFWFQTICQDCGIFSVVGDLADPGGYRDRTLYLSAGDVCARIFSEETICTSGTDFADGNWHHLIHTFGSSIGGQKLYLDGIERASGTKANSDAVAQTGLVIGVSTDAARDYFAGQIDQVAVLTRTLSQADVNQIWANGWQPPDVQLGFHLDESPLIDGTTINDSSGNGHNGVLYTGESSTPTLGADIATVSSGSTQLFATMSDGSLQYRLNDSNWFALVPRLDISTMFDTGSQTIALPGILEIENYVFDMTTGYFSGDGRQQVVLAYTGAGNNLWLQVFDAHSGFNLTRAAEVAVGTGTGWTRVAAGDVNGDGLDEIGLVYEITSGVIKFRVYKVERDAAGQWTGSLSQLYESQFSYPGWRFGATLRIAAGNIVPDTNAPKDEFVVISDWRQDENYIIYTSYRLSARLHMFEFDDVQGNHTFSEKLFSYIDANQNEWNEDKATGAGLAVGNVDPQNGNYDEVVITWPYDLYQEFYPRVKRSLRVYRYSANRADLILASELDLNPRVWPYVDYSNASFLDTLAVGDLDGDLVEEIVLAYKKDEEHPKHNCRVDVYELEDAAINQIHSTQVLFTNVPRAFSLALGDFTGESLRVGPPSYRAQRRVDSVLAELNMPPKHWDMIKKPDGSYQTIKIRTEECWTSAQDPKCTHTLHGTADGQTSTTEIETQRNWSVGAEIGLGGEKSAINASMEATYGANFAQTTTEIETTQFSSDTTAGYDDAIIYYGNPYRIWEYPILSANTTEPDGFIAVIFPDVIRSSIPDARAGTVCKVGWYNAGHQPYNVWSYDPRGDVQFPDYHVAKQLSSVNYIGSESEFKVYFSEIEESKTSNAHSHEFKGKLELQFAKWFKAAIKGSYDWKEHVTDITQASNETFYSAYLSGLGGGDIFETTAIAYWSTEGPLVLDFQTQPGEGATWQLYNKPDPAFILPWYGFPAETDADLPYPDPNNHGAPPCGPEKQHFSYDIAIDPPFATAGEPVTVTASVRNFSDERVTQAVTVRFYRGLPAAANVIGSCTLQPFERIDGPQQCEIHWDVAGAGEIKIYAVIDPDALLAEMHDENHVINNNMGYGVLQVGDAGYVDEGASGAYRAISYVQGKGLVISLYTPSANLDAAARFDLHDSAVRYPSIVGNPFEILAFQGASTREWGMPISSLDMRPVDGDPPAVVTIDYSDANLDGFDETRLMLYRRDAVLGWRPANLDCDVADPGAPPYSVVRLAPDSLLAVPVCQTGTFVLSDRQPPEKFSIYLPLVQRR